jgi:voltage-gated potassium channel
VKRRAFEILEAGGRKDPAARAVEIAIVLLVLSNVTATILETVPDLRARYGTLFLAVEFVSVALFLVEYLARLWVADLHPHLSRLTPSRARLAYAVQPFAIIDLLAILPSLVGAFFDVYEVGFAVSFRLIRFMKLARYSPGMRSLADAIMAERRALMASAVIMLGLIIAVATLMHELESAAQPEAFGSIPAAMYWAVTTLTTVGYGDVVPVTPAGKLLAGLTMIMGFTMFALPVGIIATAFAREIRQRDFVITWSMVARVPLFSELATADVADIMRLLRAQQVEAGTVITYADEPAHSMYFVVSGRVEIDLPSGRVQLGDGHFFGEIAVLRRAQRSADVIALEPTRLLVLDADDLHHLMHRRPEIGRRIRAVAEERLEREAVTPQGDIASEEIASSDGPVG